MSITTLNQPKYTKTLPICEKKVSFRPFTVKESKIMLLAKDSGLTEDIIDATDAILSACTYGKYNLDNLDKVDVEYLFIQIRNKSQGETVDIHGICQECKNRVPLTLNFDNIVLAGERKQKPIKILDDVFITLKTPSIRDTLTLKDDDGVMAIAMSLDTILEGSTSKNAADYSVEERVEFVESLTESQLKSIEEFFKNAPRLTLKESFTCKCGKENNITIDELENFFS